MPGYKQRKVLSTIKCQQRRRTWSDAISYLIIGVLERDIRNVDRSGACRPILGRSLADRSPGCLSALATAIAFFRNTFVGCLRLDLSSARGSGGVRLRGWRRLNSSLAFFDDAVLSPTSDALIIRVIICTQKVIQKKVLPFEVWTVPSSFLHQLRPRAPHFQMYMDPHWWPFAPSSPFQASLYH
jgi:hypothetical protein